jgi:YbbR domain-containing protein
MSVELEPKSEKPKPAAPPSQPQPLSLLNYYASAAGTEFRRFRQGLTRENITAFLKTMAWTVPLTLLIWVYAERQQEVTDTDIPVTIEVKSNDPAKTVSLLPTDRVIMCDLTGPRSNLDRFRESLSTNAPITIDLDTRHLSNQDNYIPTLESIKDNGRFQEAGITVDKCNPPFLTVTVDSLVTVKLAVKAPANLPTLQSAEFNPPVVSVTGPRHVLEEWGQVTADIGALPILNQPGPHPPQTVSLITDGRLSYSPSDVEATLVVKEQDERYEAHNVQIWISGSPEWLKDWSIVPSTETLPNLELIGPPEEIDNIKKGTYSPRAMLYVGPDNVHSAGPVPLAIHFVEVLPAGPQEIEPPGVRVDGANPQITFIASPRNP